MTSFTTGWVGPSSILIILILLSAIYWRGIINLPVDARPSGLRQSSYYLSLGVVAIALLSSLESLVALYFAARALQQLLLTEIIPFLFVASNPYPVFKAALPTKWRQPLRQWVDTRNIRSILAALTPPAAVWLIFVCLFWFWHDDTMLRIVSRSRAIHLIEVVSLLGLATLYWWHIAAAAPSLHKPMTQFMRLAYAFGGILPIKLTGMVMLFGEEMRVTVQGVTMIDFGRFQISDSALGAMLIWIIGGIMYALAATALASRALSREEAKPVLPVNPLERDDLWVVPGIGPGRKR